MNKFHNQMYLETERKFREALLEYLEAGKEPTVGQLCDHAQVRRSTFYRHFRDVPDLMEKMEQELQEGLSEVLNSTSDARDDLFERMVRYIGNSRRFYRIYLKQHADISFTAGINTLWDRKIRTRFRQAGIYDEKKMQYYYQFVRSGVVQVLKIWIDGDCEEDPEVIAKILKDMIVYTEKKH